MPPPNEITKQAQKLQPQIVELRRYLHENPELSFKEFQTAKLAAEKLSQLGYATKCGVGKTGVIADIGSASGPRIGIRADMDALPIQEENATKYKSKVANVMHACGHDAHISCAISAAEILTKEIADSRGAIRFLMQPAEENADAEGKSGARRMLEDDALKGVSAVIGLHMDASIPAGKVAIMPGPVMAAADQVTITIYGKGGHGAYPEAAIDPVVIGANVIQAIQQIISRRISAFDPAVITFGSFQSSSIRCNIISDYVTLEGTIRTFNKETRAIIFAELERACAIARALGGDYTIKYNFGYPTTVNDPVVTAIMHEAAVHLIGEENVVAIKPKSMAEDFSMFAELVPGAFMFLGGGIKDSNRLHHSATFDIDESGLWIGSAIMAETALRLIDQFKK